MSFTTVVEKGLDKIYAEDMTAQKIFIDNIATSIRNMNPDIIYKFRGFYVPHKFYMSDIFGLAITTPEYDCYSYSGECLWKDYLVFPVNNVRKEVVGFVGFNVVNRDKLMSNPDTKGLIVYKDSNKSVFSKSRYLFGLPDLYEDALEQGYIILTDGVFDTISASANGLVAGAFLGSYVSDEVIIFLRYVKRVYLAMDNDKAGLELYNTLKKRLPNISKLTQNKFKDLDALLKSEYKDKFLKDFNRHLKSPVKMDFIWRG